MDGDGLRLGRLGEDEPRDGRVDEEEEQERDRRDGEDVEKRADGARAPVETCAGCWRARLTTLTASSMVTSASGSAKVTTRAKRTISRAVDARTAKNSGLRPRMSKIGCASAKAESAERWAPFRCTQA